MTQLLEFPVVRPGDLVFIEAWSILSRLLKWGQHGKITHMAVIVDSYGTLMEASASGIEKSSVFGKYFNREQKIAIYRPLWLTDGDRAAMASRSQEYVGRAYGTLEIIQHLVDNKLFGGHVVTRALHLPGEICSELTVRFEALYRISLGYSPDEAEPDQCYEFVKSRREDFAQVLGLDTYEPQLTRMAIHARSDSGPSKETKTDPPLAGPPAA